MRLRSISNGVKKIIIANWKMNPKTARDAVRLAGVVARGVKNVKNVEVVLAPPFVFVPILYPKPYTLNPNLKLGAQDVFYEKKGVYTGEISPLQLKAYGVRLVIVGHSERRALGETDEIVNKKLKAVLSESMRAVLCVGEKERTKDEAFPQIVRDEIHSGLRKIKKSLFKNLIIAYEPIWAIGGGGRRHHGKADTPRDVYEMSLMIRRELYRMLGRHIALKIPILYGGSVDEKNAKEFVKEGGVDGLLVGGASLNHKKFVRIVKDISAI